MLNKIKFFFGFSKRIIAVQLKNKDYIIYDYHNDVINGPYVSIAVDNELYLYNQNINDRIQVDEIRYADRIGAVYPHEVYMAKIFSIPLTLKAEECNTIQNKEAYFIKEAYFNCAKRMKYGYIIDGKEIQKKMSRNIV